MLIFIHPSYNASHLVNLYQKQWLSCLAGLIWIWIWKTVGKLPRWDITPTWWVHKRFLKQLRDGASAMSLSRLMWTISGRWLRIGMDQSTGLRPTTDWRWWWWWWWDCSTVERM